MDESGVVRRSIKKRSRKGRMVGDDGEVDNRYGSRETEREAKMEQKKPVGRPIGADAEMAEGRQSSGSWRELSKAE
ncbi:hypothetical protein Sjap_000922 [Stephania japonica]|uniref:Uncharacterized protein n=1 Tax=Stephania japonica TaxID=461633 RepID=A0AAP0PR74_9MAGN